MHLDNQAKAWLKAALAQEEALTTSLKARLFGLLGQQPSQLPFENAAGMQVLAIGREFYGRFQESKNAILAKDKGVKKDFGKWLRISLQELERRCQVFLFEESLIHKVMQLPLKGRQEFLLSTFPPKDPRLLPIVDFVFCYHENDEELQCLLGQQQREKRLLEKLLAELDKHFAYIQQLASCPEMTDGNERDAREAFARFSRRWRRWSVDGKLWNKGLPFANPKVQKFLDIDEISKMGHYMLPTFPTTTKSQRQRYLMHFYHSYLYPAVRLAKQSMGKVLEGPPVKMKALLQALDEQVITAHRDKLDSTLAQMRRASEFGDNTDSQLRALLTNIKCFVCNIDFISLDAALARPANELAQKLDNITNDRE